MSSRRGDRNQGLGQGVALLGPRSRAVPWKVRPYAWPETCVPLSEHCPAANSERDSSPLSTIFRHPLGEFAVHSNTFYCAVQTLPNFPSPNLRSCLRPTSWSLPSTLPPQVKQDPEPREVKQLRGWVPRSQFPPRTEPLCPTLGEQTAIVGRGNPEQDQQAAGSCSDTCP